MSFLFYGYTLFPLCPSSISQLVEGLYWKRHLALFCCRLNSLSVPLPVICPPSVFFSFYISGSWYYVEGYSVFNHLIEFTSKKNAE
jgi:hypothetical protein